MTTKSLLYASSLMTPFRFPKQLWLKQGC